MAIDEVFGHPHLTSHAAHFIFEEPLQRFADAKVHLFGKSAHVVVTLDHLAGDVERFDAVRVDRALRQPLGIGDLHRLGIEYIDKTGADDLTFAFRIFHAGQLSEEFFARIHSNHIQTEAFIVFHYRVELIFAEQTVIHEDTGEPIADSLVEQHGRH